MLPVGAEMMEISKRAYNMYSNMLVVLYNRGNALLLIMAIEVYGIHKV